VASGCAGRGWHYTSKALRRGKSSGVSYRVLPCFESSFAMYGLGVGIGGLGIRLGRCV